jgi:Tol biopolymer transport system component
MSDNGTGKKRYTFTEGYDGGAVFDREGKRLVWRAYHPTNPEDMQKYRDLLAHDLTTPMKMELYISDAKGEHVDQITKFGCAAFAPTFTPDGKKIVFSSNKNNCDGRKFELFMVNVDGTELEQVTDFGGFTSFPEFSPDGKKLVFASDKDAKERYEFNIFTADWKP